MKSDMFGERGKRGEKGFEAEREPTATLKPHMTFAQDPESKPCRKHWIFLKASVFPIAFTEASPQEQIVVEILEQRPFMSSSNWAIWLRSKLVKISLSSTENKGCWWMTYFSNLIREHLQSQWEPCFQSTVLIRCSVRCRGTVQLFE